MNTEVQSLLGKDAYGDLKKGLTGDLAPATQMALIRTDDGFFVGLEHGQGEVSGKPEATAAFTCEALVSVHKSQIMHHSISEVYVPSNVIAVREGLDTVGTAMRSMLKVHMYAAASSYHPSSGLEDAGKSSGAFKQPFRSARADAHSLPSATVARLLVHEDNDQRRPLMQVMALGAESSQPERGGGFQIDIMVTQAPKGAAVKRLNAAAAATSARTTLLVPDEAVKAIVAHSHSQFLGTDAGLHITLEGTRLTVICATAVGAAKAGKGGFQSFTDKRNVSERFTAYASPFPTCIQEHTDSTYIHGLRSLITRLLEGACENNTMLPASAQEPPEFCYSLMSDPALACAIVRGLGLQTARVVEDEQLAQVFELLGISAQSSPVKAPAIWAQAGPISTFSINKPSKILRNLKTQTDYAVLAAKTMLALRPLFNAKKVSLTKMALMLKEAYNVFLIHRKNPLRHPVFLLHPHESDTDQKFFEMTQSEFNRRGPQALDNAHFSWHEHQINVYYISHELGTAFIFRDHDTNFAIGAHIINGKEFSAPAAAKSPDDLVASMQQLKLAVTQTPHDEANRQIQLAMSRGDLPAIQQQTLRGAALRLSYIDGLYTTHPVFAPYARTLRAVWLNTEQQNILKKITTDSCASKSKNTLDDRRLYYHCMHQLKQMASLPLGFNYWVTVPYY